MDTQHQIEIARAFVSDTLTFAQKQQIHPYDLLVIISMAQRLLHLSLCPPNAAVRSAIQEAEATIMAVHEELEAN